MEIRSRDDEQRSLKVVERRQRLREKDEGFGFTGFYRFRVAWELVGSDQFEGWVRTWVRPLL